VLVTLLADLWWGSTDMRRHTLPFYCIWPLRFFSKAEEMRRSHNFTYRNTETRKGLIQGRKAQTAMSAVKVVHWMDYYPA